LQELHMRLVRWNGLSSSNS